MRPSTIVHNRDEHLRYLDGCRGIAIMIVVLAHSGLGWVIPGKFGVTFFFFISGFLITKLILLELQKTGRIAIGPFYLRRFFRLYPALLSMILLSTGWSFLLHCPMPAADIYSALFYSTNYYIGWIRPVTNDCYRLLDIIWSLSVEEHFYFFFPFLSVWILSQNTTGRRRFFLWLMLVLCLLAFIFRINLYFSNLDNPQYASGRIYFSTHTRMDSIMWGCVASFLVYGIRSNWFISRLQRIRYFYIGVSFLLVSFLWRNEAFRQTALFTFQGIGLLFTVPALQFTGYDKLRRLVESPVLVFIGRISYSLYLFHWGASKLANHWFQEYTSNWELLFWSLSITLTLVSFYLVERPFVRLRRRFGSHTIL